MLTSFVLSLALTVAALAATIWSGVARRRRLHYACVVAHVVLLGFAIRQAELYGRGLVFEGTAGLVKSIHMAGVVVCFALVPVVVVTGVRLARAAAPDRRLWHRRAAWAYVIAVVVTFLLGLAMTLLARPA